MHGAFWRGDKAGEVMECLNGSGGVVGSMSNGVGLFLIPQLGPNTMTHPDQPNIPCLRNEAVGPQVLTLHNFCCKLSVKKYICISDVLIACLNKW